MCSNGWDVWQNTSVSFSGHSGVREMIHQFSLRNCRRQLGGRLWILTLRFSRRWCDTVSSMDRRSVHSADIWTVWDQIPPFPVVGYGKDTVKWTFSHRQAPSACDWSSDSRRWCDTVSSMDRRSVHSADIWTVWDQIPPFPVVGYGKDTVKWTFSHRQAPSACDWSSDRS